MVLRFYRYVYVTHLPFAITLSQPHLATQLMSLDSAVENTLEFKDLKLNFKELVQRKFYFKFNLLQNFTISTTELGSSFQRMHITV